MKEIKQDFRQYAIDSLEYCRSAVWNTTTSYNTTMLFLVVIALLYIGDAIVSLKEK